MNINERIKSYEPIMKRYYIEELIRQTDTYCIYKVVDENKNFLRMKVFLQIPLKTKNIMKKNMKRYIFYRNKLKKTRDMIRYYGYDVKKVSKQQEYDVIVISDEGKMFNVNSARLSEQQVMKLGIDMCCSLEEYNKKNIDKIFISEHNIYKRTDGSFCIGGLENDMLNVKKISFDSDINILGTAMFKVWDKSSKFNLDDLIVDVAIKKQQFISKLEYIIAKACAGDKYTYKKVSDMRKDLEDIYNGNSSIIEEPEEKRDNIVPVEEFIESVKNASKRKIHVVASTHIGNLKKINEDNVYVDKKYINNNSDDSHHMAYKEVVEATKIFAVCDGMGDPNVAKKAAFASVKWLERYHKMMADASVNEWDDTVQKYIYEVNKRICEYNHAKKNDIGSTLALVIMNDKFFKAYNLGDSRVYLIKDNIMKQISIDHTLAMQKVRMGVYTREEAKNSKDKNILTKGLGISQSDIKLAAHKTELISLESGMKILICSDGLTDCNTNTEIQTIINSNNRLHSSVERLMKNTLHKNANDNVSIIAISVE